MSLNQDINFSGIIIAILNCAAAAMNFYFSFQMKKSKNEEEIKKGLQTESKIKDKIIKDMTKLAKKRERAIDDLMKSKAEYKNQYQTQFAVNQKLAGQLEAYTHIRQLVELPKSP